MLNKIKESLKKLMDKIAEQNKANYGEGGINCCELKDNTENKSKR